MNCQEIQELIPGFALGALDQPDLLTVQKHLASCSVCNTELAMVQQVVAELPLAAPLKVPPPELKQRLMAQVDREIASTSRAPGSLTIRPPVTRPPSWATRLEELIPQIARWWIPVSLAVGLALVITVFRMQADLNRQATQVRTLESALHRQQEINSFLASSNLVVLKIEATAAAPGTQGRLYLDRNSTHALLVVDDLPHLSESQVYQLWLIRDGERDSGGTFSVDEGGYGVLLVEAPRLLNTYQAIGVTNEPLGGSPKPTGTKWLGANF
ncbi:MAG: hypothetical protein A2Z04_05430 [Chloroflexi bacterium RBG_16_57_9]|nr:MAG: hypothetical protein A2Z04_05430 [Chloroflexi bacterium RBG_16_57_9]